MARNFQDFGASLSARMGVSFITINQLFKVLHPEYNQHLKKAVHHSHLGRQKMDWFLADYLVRTSSKT